MSEQEIRKKLKNAKSETEYREIHKELKEYGDGLPLFMRYPNLPTYIMSVTLIIESITLIAIAMMR